MSTSPPWLDLPIPLTEKILERLLADYVRFPAVCRRWRSIQTDHRRHHAPSPPPMLNLPWLIPREQQDEEMVSCYSPFEDRSYRIPLPAHYCNLYCPFANRWLLLYDAIINPISGAVIPFPRPLPRRLLNIRHIAALSPPPDYLAFVLDMGRELHLFRQGDSDWTRLILPLKVKERVTMAAVFGGKLYCICSILGHLGRLEPNADNLIIVDPLQIPPDVTYFQMADWDMMPPSDGMGSRFGDCRWVVESGGELLLVREIYVMPSELVLRTVGYQVFRPDLMRRMWTRVDSLGDRLLMLHRGYSVSLLAADVGLKENCIYSSTDMASIIFNDPDDIWRIFDLGAGTLTKVRFPDASMFKKSAQLMFMPSLC